MVLISRMIRYWEIDVSSAPSIDIMITAAEDSGACQMVRSGQPTGVLIPVV
jgi:hypothetical protein